MTLNPDWTSTDKGQIDFDVKGTYELGIGMGGDIPTLKYPAVWREYTIKADADGSGALHTTYLTRRVSSPSHRSLTTTVKVCPPDGCWPPPQPPETQADATFSAWSQRQTWFNTTYSARNPLNKLEIDVGKSSPSRTVYKLVEQQNWEADIPSNFDNVWIPPYRKVVLDVSTPILGRLIIEGTLVINASSSVELTATWIEIKGGSFIIATCDSQGNVIGPFEGHTTITLLGTNEKLAAVHGTDPRQTPEITLGKSGLQMGPAVLGVMGTLIAKVRNVFP